MSYCLSSNDVVITFEYQCYVEKEEEDEDDKNSSQRKDPFNLSNDEYYNPKIATDNALRTNVGGTQCQLFII